MKATTASKCQTCSVERERDLSLHSFDARSPRSKKDQVAGCTEGGVYPATPAVQKGDDGRAWTRNAEFRVASTAARCSGGSRVSEGVEGEKPETGTTRHGFSLRRTTGDCLCMGDWKGGESAFARGEGAKIVAFYTLPRGCKLSNKHILVCVYILVYMFIYLFIFCERFFNLLTELTFLDQIN